VSAYPLTLETHRLDGVRVRTKQRWFIDGARYPIFTHYRNPEERAKLSLSAGRQLAI